MNENTDAIIWFSRALFLSLGLFATLAAMLPLGLVADSPAMPDLLIAMTFAWTIRRPESVPFLMVVGMGLFADIMLMRPIGLWAMLTLLMAEFARSQIRPLREQMFVLEWAIFAIVFLLCAAVNSLILNLTFTPGPSGDLMVNYSVATIAAYPLIVAVMHWIFRIRAPKAAAGSDRLGRVA